MSVGIWESVGSWWIEGSYQLRLGAKLKGVTEEVLMAQSTCRPLEQKIAEKVANFFERILICQSDGVCGALVEHIGFSQT